MKIQFYASLHSRDITISKIQLSDWSRPYSDVPDHIHLKSLNEDSAYLKRSLTLIPREAEDFPTGDQHFRHVPPPTYLICLSPKDLYG